MPQVPVDVLLSLQKLAYQLLLHVNHRASLDPSWLGGDARTELASRRKCAQWLDRNRSYLPTDLMPLENNEEFANLFSSFFDVSFDIDSRQAMGEVYDSRITRRKKGASKGRADSEIAIAVRYLLARNGIRIELDQARTLTNREDLRLDSVVLAYVWELERRAVGKSKGRVAHRIWLEMPYDVRTNLSEDMVWLARTRLSDAAKELLAQGPPTDLS